MLSKSAEQLEEVFLFPFNFLILAAYFMTIGQSVSHELIRNLLDFWFFKQVQGITIESIYFLQDFKHLSFFWPRHILHLSSLHDWQKKHLAWMLLEALILFFRNINLSY